MISIIIVLMHQNYCIFNDGQKGEENHGYMHQVLNFDRCIPTTG